MNEYINIWQHFDFTDFSMIQQVNVTHNLENAALMQQNIFEIEHINSSTEQVATCKQIGTFQYCIKQ